MALFRILLFLVATTMLAQLRSSFQPISPPASDVLRFQTRLTGFQAKDLSGRTWRLADLRGKLTVVERWCTWCLPCRQEHPELQHFYQETKSAKGIQVPTFSLDEDPARVRAYMNRKGYTFPVIVERGFPERLFPAEGGIPKPGVIDRQVRRPEPFRAWTLGSIVLEVEKAARADRDPDPPEE